MFDHRSGWAPVGSVGVFVHRLRRGGLLLRGEGVETCQKRSVAVAGSGGRVEPRRRRPDRVYRWNRRMWKLVVEVTEE